MLYGSLDGRGVWGRMDTYIYMAESHHSSPEIITTLLIGYIVQSLSRTVRPKIRAFVPRRKNRATQ